MAGVDAVEELHLVASSLTGEQRVAATDLATDLATDCATVASERVIAAGVVADAGLDAGHEAVAVRRGCILALAAAVGMGLRVDAVKEFGSPVEFVGGSRAIA